MNIGNLKHRISLLEYQESISPNGFASGSWVEIKKVWSEISSFKRTRKIENEKEQGEASFLFTVRYQEINEKARIRFQNKEFLIESIHDKDFSKRFLEITAREVN